MISGWCQHSPRRLEDPNRRVYTYRRQEVFKKEARAEFLTIFEMFRNQIKQDIRLYDLASQKTPHLKRKSGLKLSKFHPLSHFQTTSRF